MDLNQLKVTLAQHGMIIRGGFHPDDQDNAPSNARTILMVGNAGKEFWRIFAKQNQSSTNALDTWTRQVLTPVATAHDARVIFPFDGPPYFPFQQWAIRADDVFPSPIGPLIHPEFGLWHAYRAAFLFTDELEIPDKSRTSSPCNSCSTKPCMNTCPVGAFTPGNYDVPGCRTFISTPDGDDCLKSGCRARRTCPIGREYIYEPEQAEFHMQSFLKTD